MLTGLFTDCDIRLATSYFSVNRDGYHMWRMEMLTLSGTPDFIPFGEFMISLIYSIYITEFASLRTIFMDE